MTYRIIQWSSGNVGAHALRAVAQRAGLQLSGLYVYSADKVGVDAGQIAGVENVGVAASSDRDAMLALDADCVLHTPLPSLVYGDDPDEDLATICALLASGKNVITTVGYLYPSVHGEAVTKRIAEACEQGNSSFHGTGINPGWMGDLVPLVMSGICQRLDLVHVQEITNFQFYPSPEIIFDMMGFGLFPEKFEQHAARYTQWLTGLFRESIQMVADGLGLALDEITEHSECELCDEPLQVAAGSIAAGTIAGQRWEWAGTVKGQKKIIHETIWRTHDSIGDQWPRGKHSVRITGLPDMYVDFGAGWNSDVLLSTALHAVNAIPSVCEAAPGIRTLLDLPMIVARGGVST